jgi:hypothetical protein
MPDLIDIEAFRRQREESRSHSGKNVCPNRLLTGEGRRLLRLCTDFLGQPPRHTTPSRTRRRSVRRR